MSINASTSLKTIPIRRMFVTVLIIILGIALITGFVWIRTDHSIAPPGLRLLDELWRLFICRCISLAGAVHLM
jgi:hypothetical protein